MLFREPEPPFYRRGESPPEVRRNFYALCFESSIPYLLNFNHPYAISTTAGAVAGSHRRVKMLCPANDSMTFLTSMAMMMNS